MMMIWRQIFILWGGSGLRGGLRLRGHVLGQLLDALLAQPLPHVALDRLRRPCLHVLLPLVAANELLEYRVCPQLLANHLACFAARVFSIHRNGTLLTWPPLLHKELDHGKKACHEVQVRGICFIKAPVISELNARALSLRELYHSGNRIAKGHWPAMNAYVTLSLDVYTWMISAVSAWVVDVQRHLLKHTC